MTEPTSFFQGDTVSWSKSLSDYPSNDGWLLDYLYSRKEDARTISGVGQADGSWLMTILPAQSAQFLDGQYRWQARVSKSGDVYTVGVGIVDVIPSLDQARETRSNAAIILEAVEAVLVGKASRDQAKITIGGQSLDRFTWAELNEARAYYRSLVAREEQERANRDGTKSPAYVQGMF